MELEQLMARPQATIYCINLPDYSLPGFVFEISPGKEKGLSNE